MKRQLKNSVVLMLLLFSPTFMYSQTLDLEALYQFEAFTGDGAITGPGDSGVVTGSIGTTGGIISGFATSYTGAKHNNNTLTTEANIDILRIYIDLSDIFVTERNHSAALGGGDTLTPGVYGMSTLGNIGGDLILDGGGDTNAVFIVKFEGALTFAASSTIILSGGTRACNVYWIADGAISAGGGCTIKGTLFAHPGAISLGGGCNVEGRLLTSGGAITFGPGTIAAADDTSSIPIKCTNTCNPNPAVDVLGSVSNFSLFTSAGAVTNSAASGIVGSVGTDFGAVTGFGNSTQVQGGAHAEDGITGQAKIDLDSAYQKLIRLPLTDSTRTTAYGLGEVLTTGVYYNEGAGAGSLNGTITLDGQGDTGAIFVIRFNGAFSVAEKAKVIFVNKTQRCNVFWISEGAATMGSFVFMKGSVIAHGGACIMGSNSNVEGRMLSTAGAIGFSTSVIYKNTLCIVPPVPITLLSFTAEVEGGHVQLDWVTTAEINNDYFDVEHSIDGINFTSISRIKGAGNSTQTLNYSTVHHTLSKGVSYYRLKQTDYDGKTSYSDEQTVEFETDEVIFDIYPNPFSGKTTFHTSENLKDASLIVYNSHGAVKEIENVSGQTFTFQRENLRSGLYWIKVVQGEKVIAIKKLVITN
ncbi:MAG: hypothetical protein ACJAYZ_000123 [Bacteroidia bacterium]|mgnify:CR=1 FL=1|jgi:hypothetical protein